MTPFWKEERQSYNIYQDKRNIDFLSWTPPPIPLSPNQAIFSTSSVEMYNYVVHNGSAPGKFFQKISKFSHLLIRGLMKRLSLKPFLFLLLNIQKSATMLCTMVVQFNGLNPNQAICSSSPIEMYHFVMHYSRKA